jgi:type IV secretory pathway VirB10-like protein
MQELWRRHGPRLKTTLAAGTALGGLIGIIYLFDLLGGGGRQGTTTSSETINSILFDRDTRQPTIDGLAAQVDAARQETLSLREQVARLNGSLRTMLGTLEAQLRRDIETDRTRSSQERQRELDRLGRQFQSLEQQMAQGAGDLAGQVPPPPIPLPDEPALEDRPPPSAPEPRPEEPAAARPPPSAAALPQAMPAALQAAGTLRFPEPRPGEPRDDETAPATPDDGLAGIWRRPPEPAAPVAPGGTAARGTGPMPLQPTQIRVILPEPDTANTPIETRRGAPYHIPSGSILTGTLITGLDAPTADQAKRDPFPALLRLKQTAILPNFYQFDIRECFVLLAAYGDLSSERAMMRGENVSCVLNDGTVVETKLEGYAAGEDGKAGVRGRVVTKAGQMIGRALVVGFLQAAADVLDKSDNVQLGVSTGASTSTIPDGAVGSVALRGSAGALDRIAEWYLQQASRLFPVLEIDSGRQVDVILTGKLELPLPDG